MAVDVRTHKAHRYTVLVVDDDRRVRELLEVALSAHGFRVITAVDGEDAVRRALGDKPDLVVLDVRLPRKSGLEVCDALRGDPSRSSIPVILVSAVSETDARLQAFSRGADDFLAKPFSPKELIARIKRLLERSSEARLARRRAVELERELKLAREGMRRAHLDSLRERDLRELSAQAARDLNGLLDLDELARATLDVVQSKIGVRVAAMLTRRPEDDVLSGRAVRGDGFDRVAGLELRLDGELGVFLAGLGRPVPRRELEKFPELRDDIMPFIARGFSLVAPVRSVEGLEALIVIEERADGQDFSRADAELLATYCDALAVAIPNAHRLRLQMDHWLAALSAQAHRSAAKRAVHAEASTMVTRAAQALPLPPRQCELLGHGVALGSWARSNNGRRLMEHIRNCDPTGRVDELQDMIKRSIEALSSESSTPERWRTDYMLRVGLGYVDERAAGADAEAALARAFDGAERPENDAAAAPTSGLEHTWARELREVLASAVREQLARRADTN